LNHRLDVLDRAGEDVDRAFIGNALLDQVESVVKDALGDALLAIVHDTVNELACELRAEARVGAEVRLAGGELPGPEGQSWLGRDRVSRWNRAKSGDRAGPIVVSSIGTKRLILWTMPGAGERWSYSPRVPKTRGAWLRSLRRSRRKGLCAAASSRLLC